MGEWLTFVIRIHEIPGSNPGDGPFFGLSLVNRRIEFLFGDGEMGVFFCFLGKRKKASLLAMLDQCYFCFFSQENSGMIEIIV